jgi:DNA-binding PadR family transcriptional regulator
MAAGSESFRYFILGLLAQQAMSGYDIKQVMRGLGSLVGSPSFGAIYPALHALLQEDLVTVEILSRPDKPLRKTYSITGAGRRALGAWVAQPVPSSDSLKTFVMRLIPMADPACPALIAHLQQRREAVVAHRSALERTAAELDGRASLGQHMAMEYGLATTSAELDWLDAALARLQADTVASEQELRPEEALQGSRM